MIAKKTKLYISDWIQLNILRLDKISEFPITKQC